MDKFNLHRLDHEKRINSLHFCFLVLKPILQPSKQKQTHPQWTFFQSAQGFEQRLSSYYDASGKFTVSMKETDHATILMAFRSEGQEFEIF